MNCAQLHKLHLHDKPQFFNSDMESKRLRFATDGDAGCYTAGHDPFLKSYMRRLSTLFSTYCTPSTLASFRRHFTSLQRSLYYSYIMARGERTLKRKGKEVFRPLQTRSKKTQGEQRYLHELFCIQKKKS
jgi:hypothetical protein